MKNLILRKSVLFMIFSIFAVGLMLSFIGIDRIFSSHQIEKTALDNAVFKTIEREQYFKTFLSDSSNLLHGIAQSKVFTSYLNGEKVEIDGLFLVMAQSDSNIMQLRYIDKDGVEKIRIDRNQTGETPFIIQKEALQNKSNRYFFTNSRSKPLGKVWFSPIDLNIEHNQIEKPYKPTIRAVLPIADKNNQFNGILIINYFMYPFLNSFLFSPWYDMILADGRGYPLNHYQKNKNWGFYQSPKFHLKDEFTKQYDSIFSSTSYRGDSMVARKLNLGIDGELYLILQLKSAYLEKENDDIMKDHFIISLIVIALSFVVSYLFSFMIQKMAVMRTQLLDKIEIEQKRYQALINFSSDGVFIMGIDGSLKECSQMAANLLGYSMEEMKKLHVSDWDVMMSPEEISTFMQSLQIEKPIFFETKHKRKDGSIYDASITAVKIIIENEPVIYASTRDITDYKKQNDFIKFMQTRYTSMFNKHNSIMLLIEPQSGNIIDANESAQQFYGYTHDEFLSLSIDEINLLSREEIARYRAESVKRNKNIFIFPHKLKNGEIRTVEVFASPINTEHGVLIFSIINDVTQAKENENKLYEFNRNFEAFLYQTTDFIYFKDINSRIRFCSQTLATITGHHDWHDMIGKHDTEIFPADTAKIYKEEENLVFSTGEALLNKIDPYYDTMGEVGYVMTNKWPLRDANGNVTGIFGISRDITERLKMEEELKQLLEEQEALLEVKTTGFAHLKERHLLWTNEAMERMLGYEKGELQGKSTRIMYADEDEYRRYGNEGYVALSQNGIFTSELRAVKKDGTLLTLLASMTAMRNAPGEAMGVIVDITQQKITEHKLSKAFKENDHLLTIIDNYVSFVKVGRDGVINDISSNFCKQLGCLKQDTIGKNINILKSGETPTALYERIWKAVTSEESFVYEIQNKNFNNGTNWYRVVISPDYNESNIVVGYIAFYKNIDDQMKFKNSSETDKLTGLPNRMKIDEILAKELSRANRYHQPFSVILIDIDHFKEVNDQFGHQSGDVILQEFAKIVADNIRITDVAGRWGGEEFLVICPHTDVNGASFLAETLRKCIESNEFQMVKQKTASFGVAEYHEGKTLTTFFENVDHALYSAKNSGRNKVVIYSESK